MNHFQAIVTELERDWPDWQVWYVPRAVGGTIWCARRRDDNGRVLNTSTADELADAIEQAERES